MEGTKEYLQWIGTRFSDIKKLISDLKKSRCDAAKKFVFRIKEHSEAMTALTFLEQDIKNWNAARGGI